MSNLGFNILTVPLLQGDKNSCLDNPNNIVISQSFAQKYYPNKNPMGKTITIQSHGSFHDMKISAVLGQIPKNSLFQPEILLPMKFMDQNLLEEWKTSWGVNIVMTLVLLRENVSIDLLTQKFANFVQANLPNWFSGEYHFQPLSKVHLYSTNINSGFGEYGNIDQVRLFAAIALVILLIACINFINLSIAQTSRRVKEMGIRKIVGASRFSLVKHLLGESLLITGLSLVVAIWLLELSIPFANHILNRQMDLSMTHNMAFFVLIPFFALVVGLACGSFMAFMLASSNPVTLFADKKMIYSGNSWLGRFMISFQFIAFCGLIIASFVIQNQMSYLRNKQVGYNTEQVMVLFLPDSESSQKHNLLKQELLKSTTIKNVSVSSFAPPSFGSRIGFPISTKEEPISMEWIIADRDFLSTLEIKLDAGRNFKADEKEAFLINQTAFNIHFPGQTFRQGLVLGRQNFPVIGIVQDFHTQSLYNPINPLLIKITDKDWQKYISCVTVRLHTGHIPEGIEYVRQIWQDTYPENIFSYRFIDEEFYLLYLDDQKFAYMIHFFTILAVVISCMGLYGLITFTAVQRTKEIGIRKVLGASVQNITTLLCKEFILIGVISSVIAIPIVNYLINIWLQNFAYHIDLAWWMFALAVASALIIALLTVSLRAIRTAIANPVKALRYE